MPNIVVSEVANFKLSTPFCCREQSQSDEVSPIANDGANNNAEIGRSELLDSHSPVKTVLEKEVVVSEMSGPASERDSVQVKAKSQSLKGRQSQSGPLMPGIVLGQTSVERARVSERLVFLQGGLVVFLDKNE